MNLRGELNQPAIGTYRKRGPWPCHCLWWSGLDEPLWWRCILRTLVWWSSAELHQLQNRWTRLPRPELESCSSSTGLFLGRTIVSVPRSSCLLRRSLSGKNILSYLRSKFHLIWQQDLIVESTNPKSRAGSGGCGLLLSVDTSPEPMKISLMLNSVQYSIEKTTP